MKVKEKGSRKCKKCGTEFELDPKFWPVKVKRGKRYLKYICRWCDRARNRERYQTDPVYRQRCKTNSRIYRERHPDRVLLSQRRWHHDHPIDRRQYMKKYRLKRKAAFLGALLKNRITGSSGSHPSNGMPSAPEAAPSLMNGAN